MAVKLNIPSVVGIGLESSSPGEIMFYQSVQDALNTLDKNVLYKDQITTNVPNSRLRAVSAQAQAFTVDGTNLASGDDYIVLVQDVKVMHEEIKGLRDALDNLIRELRGE